MSAQSDYDLTTKLTNLYEQSRTRKSKLYSSWSKYERVSFNERASEYLAANMPTPFDNEIYPVIATLVSHMLDQNQGVYISPLTDPDSPYREFFNSLSDDLNIAINAAWQNYDFDKTFQEIIWDAAVYGAGIAKTSWDDSLASGKGDVAFTRISPWSFYPDPQANDLTDGNYYIEVRRMSKDEIKRRFPMLAKDLTSLTDADDGTDYSRPDVDDIPKANIAQLITGQPGAYGLPGQSGKLVQDSQGIVILECWLRDLREVKHNDQVTYEDRWRCILMARSEILLDEWAEDLYGFNNHPYSRFVFDQIGKFYPPSLVHYMASPQIAIHRLLASMQQNAELTGNPVFMDSANSGISRTTLVNRPGQRLTLSGAGTSTPPGWLTPPDVPPYILELVQFWIARIENISGLSGSVKGMAPQPRTPNASVQSSAESAFVRVRNALRNMEMAIRNSMSIAAELIVQNYNEKRTIAYMSDIGNLGIKALKANHFYIDAGSGDDMPLEFYLNVDMGSDSTTSKSARISNAITLYTLGAIDQKELLNTLRMKDADKIIARMIVDGPGRISQKAATRG